jgi:hypothetical protein
MHVIGICPGRIAVDKRDLSGWAKAALSDGCCSEKDLSIGICCCGWDRLIVPKRLPSGIGLQLQMLVEFRKVCDCRTFL